MSRFFIVVTAAALVSGCNSAGSYEMHPGTWEQVGSSGAGGAAGGGGGPELFPPNPVGDGGFVCAPLAAPELSEPIAPARPPPPISGGTMAVVEGVVVVGDSDRDQIYLVSPDLLTSSTVALRAGDEPGRVAPGPKGLAFVALRGSGEVAVVDLASRQLLGRLEACPAPRGVAWVERQSSLFVACATGELAQLQLSSTGKLVGRTVSRPADDLRDVLDTGDGLLLTTFRDAHVLHRTDDGAVAAWTGPAKHDDGTFPNDAGGFDSFGQQPHVAWKTVGSGSRALMVHQQSQTGPVGFGCSGYGGVAGPVVQSVLVSLSPSGTAPVMDLANAPMTVDVAMSESGKELATASVGGLIQRQLESGGGGMNQVPGQPVALAFGGGRLLVYSREPAMLVALPSLESPGAVVLQPSGSGRPVPTRPGSSTEVWQLTLSARSVESTGHALFHVPTHAGIACASCHPEAGEDGHVWRPPEGTRRTPTLRGGLKGTAPFHWGGELSNMDTLMSEVMSHRMGGAEQSPARVAALADWLDAQPALPAPSWLDVDAVARGKALFEGAAACTSCHAGALGTNNATLDVGTGGPFQVPRLVELARRAPYFHDGRIPTLAARFTAAGGGKLHGTVEGLSTAQISDLVAYLASR